MLPASITRLRVAGIAIGGRRVTVDVEDDEVTVEGAEGYEVIASPRPPLSSLLAD